MSDKAKEFLRKSFWTNQYVAEYPMSLARLRLYDMLEQISVTFVYCDTDFVVYMADDDVNKELTLFIDNSLEQY